MTSLPFVPAAKFVNTHFVDEQYHKHHSQLVHQHKHELELFYVMKGSGQYIVEKREYAVQPGSLVICNAGILHGEVPFQKYNMISYCCVLTDVQIPNLPPNTLMNAVYSPVLSLTANRQSAEHILLALHDLNTQPEPNEHVCNLLSNSLLDIVYREILKLKASNNPRKQKTEDLIRSISEYLDEHFMEEITLQQLGEIFHMSHYYLARLFKRETGRSPINYVMHRRIGEAQNLLMNSDMPIGKISESLGFGEHCHLNSMFKKYIGITPSGYRKHFRQPKTVAEADDS